MGTAGEAGPQEQPRGSGRLCHVAEALLAEPVPGDGVPSSTSPSRLSEYLLLRLGSKGPSPQCPRPQPWPSTPSQSPEDRA